MTVCVVNGCHNASGKVNKASNITFHLFPSDPALAAKWIAKVRLNRNESYWRPTKSSKMCSIHFNEKDKYITNGGGQCRLRSTAVPTENIAVFCFEKNDGNLIDHNKPEQSSNTTIKVEIIVNPTSMPVIKQEILDFEEESTSKPNLNEEVEIKIEPVSDKEGDPLSESVNQNSEKKKNGGLDLEKGAKMESKKKRVKKEEPEDLNIEMEIEELTSGSEVTDSEAPKSPNDDLFILDTPEEASVRRQLNKVILFQKKRTKKIKSLKKRICQLLKENSALYEMNKDLKKQLLLLQRQKH